MNNVNYFYFTTCKYNKIFFTNTFLDKKNDNIVYH